MENFEFTNNWFNDAAKHQWDRLIPGIKPNKILEIGSYEGASTCYLTILSNALQKKIYLKIL